MIIAIDGPAGAGKSTVAKQLAKQLGFVFLNSGSFYRAITLTVLDAGIDVSDTEAVVSLAKQLKLEYGNGRMTLNGTDVEALLHADRIDLNASKVSAIVPLRHLVNETIRRSTAGMNIVCEGRDMTTVVFTDAEYKFYLDASLEVQALRRFNQGVSSLPLDEIRRSIRERDELDKNKAEGSLKIAPDACYIDTSDLTIDEVCAIIICKIQL